MKLFKLCLLSSLMLPGLVQAEGLFGTFGGSLVTHEDSAGDVKPINVLARLGYDFNENFALVGEANFTLVSDDFAGVDFDVNIFSAFGQVSLPVSDTAKVYGLLGFSNVELEGDVGGLVLTVDDDDTSYGFGVEFGTTEVGAITIDWIQYYDDDGVDTSGFNLGYKFHF